MPTRQKPIFFIIIMLWVIFLFAQKSEEFETTTQLQIEQQFSERIENILYPFVGENIVIVNLTLKYPDFQKSSGMDIEKNESLDLVPVSRKKIPLLSDMGKDRNFMTQILSKKISVYLQKEIDEEMETFLHKNLPEWLNIDQLRGDVLELNKILTFKESSDVEIDKKAGIVEDLTAKAVTPNYMIILGLLLLVILFIFIMMLRSGLNKLSNSVRSINFAGSDKELFVKGGSQAAKDIKSTLSLDTATKIPLPIRIIEKEDDKTTALDFHFLEDLSIRNFFKLIQDESNDVIAHILTRLSIDYTHKFFEKYPVDSDKIIKAMISETSKTKNEIEKIRKNLFEKYEKLIEQEELKFAGKDTLVKVINKLSSESSKKIVDQINDFDQKIGEEIRKRIFLLEDVMKLNDDEIEKIVMNIDHDLFVQFLVSIDQEFKDKFYGSLTTRATSIIDEDIYNLNLLSDEEKEQAINSMLNETRRILNY